MTEHTFTCEYLKIQTFLSNFPSKRLTVHQFNYALDTSIQAFRCYINLGIRCQLPKLG